jgi:single-stranded DNA-specific DHH superfamily exonuclease
MPVKILMVCLGNICRSPLAEGILASKLPKEKLILFLDLASGSLNNIKNANLNNVFIIDHHEINQKVPENVRIINPHLTNKQKISGSGLTYLFCK